MTLEQIQQAWSRRPGAAFMPCPITAAEETLDNRLNLTTSCPICNKTNKLTVRKEGIVNWLLKGQFVQTAFPELNADQREILINGVCCL